MHPVNVLKISLFISLLLMAAFNIYFSSIQNVYYIIILCHAVIYGTFAYFDQLEKKIKTLP